MIENSEHMVIRVMLLNLMLSANNCRTMDNQFTFILIRTASARQLRGGSALGASLEHQVHDCFLLCRVRSSSEPEYHLEDTHVL